jgi:hypothetical protein
VSAKSTQARVRDTEGYAATRTTAGPSASSATSRPTRGRDVSGLRGGDERVEETLLLGEAYRPAMLTAETAAGTGDGAAGVHLAQREDLPDLPVRVIKRLPQDVGGTFSGRKLLQEVAQRQLERFALLGAERRIGCAVDGLGRLRPA